MRIKFKLASLAAVAVAMTAAAVAVHGSGAAAQEWVPTLVVPEAQVRFTSDPIVQTLPEVESTAPTADDGVDFVQPQTLTDLVAAQSQPDELSSEMRCLAGAIYFEAKGQTLPGQLAVGRVVVNRTKSGRFPDSYCGVVYQRSQFSFVRGSAMPAIRTGSRAWHQAVAIAQIADTGSWHSQTEGALYFHAARVSPGWRMTRIARVDDHVFYR